MAVEFIYKIGNIFDRLYYAFSIRLFAIELDYFHIKKLRIEYVGVTLYFF